jgi:hypothetical protein
MNKGIKETLCLTMAFALIAGIFAGCKDKIAPDITSGSEEAGETTTTITVPVVSDTDPVAGADNGTNGGAVPSTGSFPGLDYTILATDPFGIRERHKGYHIRKVSDPDIHYYIIICSGEKNTGGYGIDVTRIEMEDDDTLIIEAAETSPAEGDIVTQAFTYPQCIIELSRMPTNRPMAITTASMTATTIAISIDDFPVFCASHFSNFVGSSVSSSPKSSADLVIVNIPVARDSIKATTPRITGIPKMVPFFALEGLCIYSLTILPSGRRTASAIPPSGVRIITPSITA